MRVHQRPFWTEMSSLPVQSVALPADCSPWFLTRPWRIYDTTVPEGSSLSPKFDSRTPRQRYPHKNGLAARLCLTGLLSRNLRAAETEYFRAPTRQGYASLRQSYAQSDMLVLVVCDFRHKIAVWQRYGLFRFVSCNYQQRKDLT
jgi:hypothetical protein